ncbi:MAG: response regulator [candidate division Zixibacteria bacterium]|nr:response regulator [candidate division Zixibacteria bacterium]
MHNILIIDDEPNIIKGLKRAISNQIETCRCVGMTAPAEAIEEVRNTKYDLVILDYRMPEMDGIEFLTMLKAQDLTQNIPVIMLTAIDDIQTRRLALQLGAYDFVSKPADADELVIRIRNALRLSIHQDELEKQNRKLEEQLIQSQKMEMTGILARGAAHDLNNLLHNIIGLSELESLQDSENHPAHANTDAILSSAEHAADLVKQILDIGKPPKDANNTIDIGKAVDSSIDFLRAALPSSIRIKWENPNLKSTVSAKENQIRQILYNLCLNAADAMEGNGEILISLTERKIDLKDPEKLRDARPGNYLVFSVADSGCGMDKNVLESIFDVYYTTKESKGGSGIGLSVVSRIVENLGGFIDVKSKPEEGSVFSMYIPIFDRVAANHTQAAHTVSLK